MENEKTMITLGELIKTGLTQNNSEFRLISNIYDWRSIATFAIELYPILKSIKKICTRMSKTYERQIRMGAPDPALLVSLRQLMTCYNFYWREYATALDMSDEYINYVLSGHILDTLCCYERPDEDMVDSRRKD